MNDKVLVNSKIMLNGINIMNKIMHIRNIVMNLTPKSGTLASTDHTSVECPLGR